VTASRWVPAALQFVDQSLTILTPLQRVGYAVSPCPTRAPRPRRGAIARTQAYSQRAADIDDLRFDRPGPAVPLDRQMDRLADAVSLKLVGKQPAHTRVVHRDNDVAESCGVEVDATQAGALGRRARRGPHHDHSLDTEPGGDGLIGGDYS
jgi:hypothetical protein